MAVSNESSESSKPPAPNATTSTSKLETKKSQLTINIIADDLPYEEELIRNPFSVKHWLRYIEHKKSCIKEELELPLEKRKFSDKDLHYLYERALLQMPMSYKLWSQYLKLRLLAMKDSCLASPAAESVNNTFERCLVFMHRMPRIWLLYLQFLMDQQKITRTRKTFDRALCALPITQHDRVWDLYLKFVMMHDIPETAVRVWRRYLKLKPEDTEDYINYLVAQGRLQEAARQYEWCVNTDAFASKYGKSKYQLWSELCDLLSNNPEETSLHNAEAIMRHGLQRYVDQTGRLWNCLAQYYIKSALFERARDVYEEAMRSVMTVRDFTQVFDAYAQFEELLLSKQMEDAKLDDQLQQDDFNLRLARYEDLIERRALLLNSVMLRQNPHNVIEWQKRVSLYASKPKMVVTTYMEAVKTIDPKQAAGKLWQLWVDFACFYENNGQLKDARLILEKATQVAYVKVDDLASVWCEWAEMELRNDNEKQALQLLKRATAIPGARVDYHDESETVQRRLHKCLKLWSLYADLEESLGTFQSCKAVYDRIIDLRIATPQIIINYGMFLQENNYFEEAFKAYEKGIALFKWPYVYDIWNTYLTKFLERYKGSKIERARDLFEQCLEKCPAKYCKALYLLYANMEEQHGLARHALQVYSRATKSVPPDQKLELYNVYIQHASQLHGIAKTRAIYQEAIEELPDVGAREMCMRFAETERLLGEIDRAREIFVYASELCDPRVTKEFWDKWTDFEVQHGNEDTMRELLRIRRSLQAKYSTQINQMSAQMLSSAAAASTPAAAASADSMQALEARTAAAAPSAAAVTQPPGEARILFVRSDTSARDEEVAAAARVPNPEEINLDDEEEEEEEDLPQPKAVPSEVFAGLK
ncbi:pre-mRNA-splicing factor SYF1 isoform X2 [Hyalella azteca]|uniref:Pre-mRNA-splicing factor SYF1 n=1 Tax=Hyalella azteca TaxID=294128 RepID=A0A8B7P8B2_HYAAZ|nr:pre-mRNA-splicing factor SYF1 isoform X2 [Hyalella azteca]